MFSLNPIQFDTCGRLRLGAFAALCTAWLLLLGATPQAAASPADGEYVWVVESPARGASLTETPVLISALLLGADGPAHLSPQTRVLINNDPVSEEVIIDGGRLVVLLGDPLPAGSYTVVVDPISPSGPSLPLARWSFTVTRPEAPRAPIAWRKPASPVSFLDGSVQASLRTVALNGPGRDLRQEPVRTAQLTASLRASAGEWDVPVSAYWTSDASASTFRRNRFSVGVERSFGAGGPDLTVRLGDVAPSFGSFTTRGVQTRGTYAEGTLGGVTVRGVYGQTRRALPRSAVPGESTIASTPAPVYDRRIGVLEVSQSTSHVGWSVRALRGRDLISSLPGNAAAPGPTDRPGDNTVVEPSMRVDIPGVPLQLEAGTAWSVTTNDRRLGAFSSDEIRTRLGLSPAASVERLGAFMTLNTSTTPLSDPGSALAWRAAGTVSLARHQVTMEHQSVGAAFQSFGTAFLQTGRRQTTLRGQSHFLDGRVLSRFRLRRETSRGHPDASGFRSNAASGSVRAVAVQHPDGTVTASLRASIDDRTFGAALASAATPGAGAPTARLHSLSPALGMRWTTGPLQHRLRIRLAQTVQDAPAGTGISQRLVQVSATESFRNVDLGGGWSRLSGEFDAGDRLQDARRLHTHIGFHRSSIRARLQLSHWHARATRFQPDSRRSDASLSLRWRHAFGAVRVRLGYRNLNAADGAQDYTETYALIEPTVYL